MLQRQEPLQIIPAEQTELFQVTALVTFVVNSCTPRSTQALRRFVFIFRQANSGALISQELSRMRGLKCDAKTSCPSKSGVASIFRAIGDALQSPNGNRSALSQAFYNESGIRA